MCATVGVGSSPIISNNLMKKLFLSFLLAFSSIELIFAFFEPLPESGTRPQQYIQFDLGITPKVGIEHDKQFFLLQYSFDWEPFVFWTGFESDGALSDFGFRTDYLPFCAKKNSGRWLFGASFTYHFQNYSDEYHENDFSTEAAVKWKSDAGFSFLARGGFHAKITRFPDLPKIKITDRTMAARVQVNKVWPCGIEIGAGFGSYNDFRYPLFFCPQLDFELAYNIKKRARIGAELEAGMTDFWASVAYFNYMMIKVNMRFCF